MAAQGGLAEPKRGDVPPEDGVPAGGSLARVAESRLGRRATLWEGSQV